jgi:hypothetical protein
VKELIEREQGEEIRGFVESGEAAKIYDGDDIAF